MLQNPTNICFDSVFALTLQIFDESFVGETAPFFRIQQLDNAIETIDDNI